MDQESYEYTGMMADAWDLLRGDTSIWSDRFFYRDLIGQYGQPVLDVGCGTGRLLLDYLSHTDTKRYQELIKKLNLRK